MDWSQLRAQALTIKRLFCLTVCRGRQSSHTQSLVYSKTFSANVMRACITTTVCKQMHALSHVWDLKTCTTECPLRASTNSSSSSSYRVPPKLKQTHAHPILYALIHTFTHVKHRPYTHPFVHSQGIFQWAKPGTGYTAAGTSAQCMSVKSSIAFSLFQSNLFCLFFALISYFPKLW